jgi:hypothetical protein
VLVENVHPGDFTNLWPHGDVDACAPKVHELLATAFWAGDDAMPFEESRSDIAGVVNYGLVFFWKK